MFYSCIYKSDRKEPSQPLRIHFLGKRVSYIRCNLLSTKAMGPEQIRLVNNSLSHYICEAFLTQNMNHSEKGLL